jgi:hypothetical protein
MLFLQEKGNPLLVKAPAYFERDRVFGLGERENI